jgi:outer membrane lipoprotein-sorting protein
MWQDGTIKRASRGLMMRKSAKTAIWSLAALSLFAATAAVVAQEAKKTAPANPVGAVGKEWTTTLGAAGQPGQARVFEDRQVEAINKVSAYFSALAVLKADFVQTNPDAKKMRGKLAVKRPGKFRFDYNRPSRQVVVSDGRNLAVQDLDIKTDDRYELDRTPFRLLLKADVDLLKDANIFEVQVADDLIVIALQDKSPDTPGRIKLFLATKPVMELKEWVTTDAQNLDTRVELSSIDIKDDLDPKMFDIRSVALERLQQP